MPGTGIRNAGRLELENSVVTDACDATTDRGCNVGTCAATHPTSIEGDPKLVPVGIELSGLSPAIDLIPLEYCTPDDGDEPFSAITDDGRELSGRLHFEVAGCTPWPMQHVQPREPRLVRGFSLNQDRPELPAAPQNDLRVARSFERPLARRPPPGAKKCPDCLG